MAAVRIPREQRRWWVVGVLGVTLGVALAVWFGLSASRGVHWTDTGHQVTGDGTVKARFDVIDPARRPVTCTVEAVAHTRAVVGSRTVTFPASRYDSTQHVVEIRTTERAVAASVRSCRHAG